MGPRAVCGHTGREIRSFEVCVVTNRSEALRIALVAPPFLPIPPLRYGGTERVVGVLADGFHRRGHEVTVFAAGDSQTPGRLVPVVPQSTWDVPSDEDTGALMARMVDAVAREQDQFDVIHSHLEWYGFEFAARASTPVVSTLHGRIDIGATAERLPRYPDIQLVAISDRQRSFLPDLNWIATIYHGLEFEGVHLGTGAGGYLLFVGRITPEKGLDAAVDLARRSGLHLMVAAKAHAPHELETYRQVIEPAEREGIVTFLGEVGRPARDRLFGDALATVMLGEWPEPFGLVAVESLAAGTPLIARRAGALPEIVRNGIDGFVVDDVDAAVAALGEMRGLDRAEIRASALARFSAERMVREYEDAFRDLVGRAPATKSQTDGSASETSETPLGVI
jgi:glycosyltransferase involved in cell wall biosynthesis